MPSDWADYSYVMPVGAFGYAVLTLLAVVFLHEDVSLLRWIGVILVCIGVFLVGRTKPSTTETHHMDPGMMGPGRDEAAG